MIGPTDFDALYRADPDPFRVGSSFYEQRKLAVALASLTEPDYPTAWDAACGTGELAARLAPRTGRLVATDGAAEAVRLAARRCADHPQVDVRHLVLPAAPQAPEDGWSLVVLSEFVYYLSEPDRSQLLEIVTDQAAADATVLAVHWRHHPHDAHLAGADVQRQIVATLQEHGWQQPVHHDDTDFVLDVCRRPAA